MQLAFFSVSYSPTTSSCISSQADSFALNSAVSAAAAAAVLLLLQLVGLTMMLLPPEVAS